VCVCVCVRVRVRVCVCERVCACASPEAEAAVLEQVSALKRGQLAGAGLEAGTVPCGPPAICAAADHTSAREPA
jgi:hypothetical protein